MLPGRLYAPKCMAKIYTRDGLLTLSARGSPDSDDLLSMRVEKSIGQPTGTWGISLTGRRDSRGRMYDDLISPQDYVELYMSRTPGAGGALDLVMRGFVDNAGSSIVAGHMATTINGRNYGKHLLKTKVYYLTEIDPVVSLVPQARLEINFGIPGGLLSPREFVALINDKILKPNIAAMRRASPALPELRIKVRCPDRFSVNGFTVQPYSGPVWNLLEQYASKPWIEVFIEDEINGPTLHWRFAPYKTYDGGRISAPSEGVGPPTVIESSDLISLNLSRSDNEVYTYYFSYPTYSLLDRQTYKAEGITLQRNPYVDFPKLERYGFSPLEADCALIPSLSGDPQDLAARARPELVELAAELNLWLVSAYQDNERFKSGSIVVKGGAETRMGRYIMIRDLALEGYVTSVAHDYDLQGAVHQTTLGLTRVRPTASGAALPATGGGGGQAVEVV